MRETLVFGRISGYQSFLLFMVQIPINNLDVNVTINELIDSNTNEWSTSLIREIFNDESVDLITSLPLSS